MKIEYAPGATPLDPDEAAGLIPTSIATRGQLDEFEAANIADGLRWAASRRRDVLTIKFMQELHRRMFRGVWRWAGTYRKSGKNIGVPSHDIVSSLKDLADYVRTQINSGSLAPDEIALRFHHRLTKIHPFPNGNGRHARLMTDLLLQQLGAEPFNWGAADLAHAGEPRDRYIEALRAADAGDCAPLASFLKRRV
jgi:Fic-DOC domain mobile mystery protein B